VATVAAVAASVEADQLQRQANMYTAKSVAAVATVAAFAGASVVADQLQRQAGSLQDQLQQL
jgi:hypothetical protein